MKNKILLVGSIPGSDAHAAMRLCGSALGPYLDCLPDGETGNRRIWINYLAATTYHGNPALETVNRPAPVDPKHPEEWRQRGEDWAPRGYDDHWQFRIRPGMERVTFETLGYSGAAKASYPVFCDLRDEGVFPRDMRFMVAIPLTESAIRPFLHHPDDFDAMWSAYESALGREIEDLTNCIPANDLVIQWDVCMEVLAAEADATGAALFPWEAPGSAIDRFTNAVRVAAGFVPPRTLMGLHLCYGDLGHRHVIEPTDLGVVTTMAAAAAGAVRRPIDYYHVPVPRGRADDDYFAPLDSFDAGDARLYIGLIHTTGGIDTSLRLLETARRHAEDFGIATECGFGRRPPETMNTLLDIHRQVAELL